MYPANHVPGVKNGHIPGGSLVPIDLQWEKLFKKSSSPKSQGPELSYFVCINV